MKYRMLMPLLVAAATFTACSDDDLSSTSIFSNTTQTEQNELDKWIKANLTDPYNIQVNYRYVDKETSQSYNVIPAEYDKSVALAQMVKHVWVDAYKEVAGADFIKSYSPRVYQFIGSPMYNNNGSITIGLAEGGVKVSLFRVNELDVDNMYINVDDPLRDHYTTPLDLNHWFFHTMHHEFCHILTQTKNYSTDFSTISAVDYNPNQWMNTADEDAFSMGFVTAYASSESNEDFAELYATYVSHSEEGWAKILDVADNSYEFDGNNLVPVTDENGNVVYAKDAKGNPIYILDSNGQRIRKTDATTVGNVYRLNSNGDVVVYFTYNNSLYNAATNQTYGNPVYQTDADGNTVYDKDGNPVPDYFLMPEFKYMKPTSSDLKASEIITQKMNIVKEYFEKSWGIDLDELRTVVLRRFEEVKTMDLKTLN